MLDYSPMGILVRLLSEQTERDRQRLVGASQMSDPCSRCLARAMSVMLNNPEHRAEQAPRGKYFLGAVIGTFVHAGLEERATPDPNLVPETKVTLGTIKGYGTIRSTSDLYVKPTQLVVDHKTSTKEKLAVYKRVVDSPPNEYSVTKELEAEYTIKRYLTQLQLYGMGIENAGYGVKNIAIAFIPRDAKQIDDLWTLEVPYSREAAERAFSRAEKIWGALTAGKGWSTFKSQGALCWQCSNG